MFKKLTLLVVAVALFVMVGTVAAANNRNFRAHLSGEDAGAMTLGQGQAIFQFSRDGESLTYKLIVANIDNVTMAHIHLAPVGQVNGPPVLWLYPENPPAQLIPGTFNGILYERTVTAANLVGPLAGMTLEDLRAAIQEGRTYVNVHTSQYPPGEIRGQLR